METELKNCPFCGAQGRINHRKVNNDYVPECTSQTCIASYMLGSCFPTVEAAAEAWNTRHQNEVAYE